MYTIQASQFTRKYSRGMKPLFSSFLIGNIRQISRFLFLLLASIFFLVVIHNEELSFNLNAPLAWSKISTQNKIEKLLPFAVGKIKEGCDLFSGKWVKDELTRPLYQESDCPYIKPQVKCQSNGRPDNEYLYWRWQPHGCSIPRFNATLMLETLRGKKMMFVGDSLIRGQFVSMVCLLHSVIPNNSKSMDTCGNIFKAKDYNVTIEFYWAPFLLESNSDDPAAHRISESERMVRIGSINKHGVYWKGVDILVYNSYLWWMARRNFKILKGCFGDEVKEIIEVKSEDAYSLGMKSMLRWIEKNMDPTNTRVFFTAMSPSHYKSMEWGGKPSGNCYDETHLIKDSTYGGSDGRKNIMQMTDKILSESKVPITYLNITQLSSYRKEAHTSIYKKHWRPLTYGELMNPVSYADCVHWCLPGLQDTWNELLFTTLLYT